ncbi:MAG TPA: DUF6159 family protein [Solirubrobacterales bacterium]
MRKIKLGWELTKKSWALLREHRELFRFPVYGTLASLPALAVVIAAIVLLDIQEYGVGVILLVAGLYLTSLVGLYFSVGLAATADAIFHGRDATVGDGLAAARARFGSIAGWAAVSTAVSLVVAAIQYFGELGEQIVASLLNGAWDLITFLAVPVIAFEGTSALSTLKRSAHLFRERWAGQVTGNVAIGGIVFLVGFLPAIALIAVGVLLWISDGGGEEMAAGGVLVAIGLVVFLVSSFVVRTMRGVFGVALYRYAANGETTAAFTEADLESAVRTRGAPRTA